MLQGVGTTAVYNSGDYHYASGVGTTAVYKWRLSLWEPLVCVTRWRLSLCFRVGTTGVYLRCMSLFLSAYNLLQSCFRRHREQHSFH